MCFIYHKASFQLFGAKLKSVKALPAFGACKVQTAAIFSENIPVAVAKIWIKFSLLRPPSNYSHLFLEELLEQAHYFNHTLCLVPLTELYF